MAICKLCHTFAPPHHFRGGCAEHSNKICATCFDKHALDTLSKTRGFKVYCMECGEILRESEIDQRLSRAGRRELNVMKYYVSLAGTKEEDPAEESDEEDYVMAEKKGALTEMNGGWKGANKRKSSKGKEACAVM
ncbi:hypothetical protein CKM354_000909300 [Cercospora kikuchii]|uniref:Uncharacterized protein n=1 Tax=Cercospora kikuchii TaxID=84275 RepID=A0A9P3FIZ0_9PEZI|nr:uncharacterized protein CKM354_000909300 [Cercospora kikuchii]GIZ45947.1 hypothetical protein CKM354_000909300 [Cercospora kikuchii]